MGYTVASVEQMAEKLRSLPPVEKAKRELNKQEAVKQLAEEIVALQGKGYTIEQITESLRGVGLDINTPTLKSYLQRARTKKRKGGRAGVRALHKPTVESPPDPKLRAGLPDKKKGTEPEKDEAPKKSGKDAFLINDKDTY